MAAKDGSVGTRAGLCRVHRFRLIGKDDRTRRIEIDVNPRLLESGQAVVIGADGLAEC